MNSIHYSSVIAIAVVTLAFVAPVTAQQGAEEFNKDDPNLVLAYQGDAVITQQEIDAAFSKIPEKNRLAFIRDGAKVDQMLRTLLEIKMLANDAKSRGLDEDTMVKTRLAMAADEELAGIWSERIPEEAPAADYEALAREDYLANPEKYDRNASIDLTQILLSTKDRSQTEAMELAGELQSRLEEDPGLFQSFVAEYSDDPAKLINFGRLETVTKGQMVKPFEDVAFAMEEIGEISEPVITQYGVHLIRLDARNSEGVPPYEEIREDAIEKQKKAHQQIYFRKYLSQLFMNPVVFPEGSIEIMARRHFGENLEKAPIYSEDKDQ